jgi:hypothetical protein
VHRSRWSERRKQRVKEKPEKKEKVKEKPEMM